MEIFKFFEKGAKPQQKIEGKKPEESLSRTPKDKTPEEEILESAPITESKILECGPYKQKMKLVKFGNNGEGIFKPKEGARWLRDAVQPDSYYKREESAYLVDKFLEFNLIPPIVIRKIDGKIGSVQQFIPDTKSFYEIGTEEKEIEKIEQELFKLWILDYILWNSDRHGGNFLIKNNEIHAIDNELTFGKDYFGAYCSFFDKPFPKDMVDKFEKFFSWEEGEKILRDLLLKLLNKKEVDACFKRIKRIRNFMQKGKIPRSAENELTFD